VIRAAGAIPVTLCSTSEKPIAAGEEHLPRNLCPLIKASYGFALTDTCPYFHFCDIVVGETTCDGKKKMYELLDRLRPTHVMQLPQTYLGDEAKPCPRQAKGRRDGLPHYLGIPCSCMTPNTKRLDLLDTLVDDYRADGVVDIILQACHTYNVETFQVREHLQAKKNIPYIAVETDYYQGDVEQLSTRMGAFIEMMPGERRSLY
jgi:benzoyl-CoA reductase/2-hydroxyglutaryl-CoA dehydratase subunit BcrC/BadD/HgdB